jgi:tripartite-type tricarboxylate transporter receptor subunit TctC
MMRRINFPKVILLGVAILMFSGGSVATAAKPYPARPIDVIIGFAAGGGGDTLLRIITQHLEKALGQSIIVVNKPGGGAIPAVLDVMKSKPDGYTLSAESQATSAFQMGRTDIPFDPLEKTYICNIAVAPYALYVDPKMPWQSLDDVAGFIKKTPEKFIWGGIGGPSGTTFSQLQFFDHIGADIKKMKMVVYKGSGPILIAAAGGHVMWGSAGASAVPPFHQSKKVRVLAVTGNKRVKNLPGVPTAKEVGYPLTVDMWLGLSGPPGLPQEVVDTLNKAVNKIIESPAFITDLEKVCSVTDYKDPATLRKEVIEVGKMAQQFRDLMGW